MRKAIKIKTLLMLLSWMVIFLHGVIPHNHHLNHKPGCHYIIHNTTVSHEQQNACDHGDKESPLYHSADSEKICHFNTKLFQNSEIDNFFIAESGWQIPYALVPETKVIKIGSDLKKPPAFRSCMLLRAPPHKGRLT